MNKLVVSSAVLLCLSVGISSPLIAHVTYKDLDATPVLVTTTFTGSAISDPCSGKTTGCQSSNAFTRYGWLKGTEATLGDSHFVTVNAEFWKFHLAQTSTVTITFVQGQANLDPALSVYSGLLQVGAHDDTLTDPLNPTSGGCAIASPKDAHAPPYTYLVHDGFRDTLNFSTTGGLSGCLPVHPFVGQFDAFASWSMAVVGSAPSAWSAITYVSSVSAAAFTGHNGGTHVAGNHNTAVGTGETITLVNLPGPGYYTIAAGGEACVSTSGGTCTSPRLYGTVSYTHSP